MFLADIYLGIQGKNDTNEEGISYKIATAADIAGPNSPFHFLCRLSPDLLVKKEIKQKRTAVTYHIFETFRLNLPHYLVKKKIKDVIDFYYSGEWEDNTGKTFPVIMIICPTLAMLIQTKRLTKKLLEEEDNPKNLHFKFTTVDEVKKHGVTGEIWEEA